MKGEQAVDSLDVLYIEITSRCNYSCLHCGNRDCERGDLEFAVLKRVMNEFNECHGKKLILTGGEPLLHPGLREILDLASKHDYNTKISTNGYLLTDPKFSFVLNSNFGFRLSLDGTKEVHNKIRQHPEAYDRLMDSLARLGKGKRQIVLRTTVMKPNKDCIPQMLEELCLIEKFLPYEWPYGIYSVNIWPMRGIGKANRGLMLEPEEYTEFLRDLNDRTRTLKPRFRIIVGPTFGIEKEFAGGPLQSNEIYTCDILNTSLHIASDYSVYPCSFVQHSLGSIKELSLQEIFRSKKAIATKSAFLDKKSHSCGSCESYAACRAGCIAERFPELIETGKPVRDIYCFR